MSDSVEVEASGDVSIDALTMARRWTGPTLTWSVPTAADQYGDYAYDYKGGTADETVGWVAPPPAMLAAARSAMRAVEGFTNLDLVELTGGEQGDAEIRVGLTSTPKAGKDGNAYAVGPLDDADPLDHLDGDVWFPTDWNPVFGGYDWIIVAHELDHSLGLQDVNQVKDGGAVVLPMAEGFRSTEFSIQSYMSHEGSTAQGWMHAGGNAPQSHMMYDIAALQFLYGADYETNAGATTYRFSPTTGEMFVNGVGQGASPANVIFRTIWDGGGGDTYDFSLYGADRQLDVDLAPGGWTDVDRDSTFQASNLDRFVPGGVFARGQVFNALLHEGDTRSLIENAVGGAGDDRMRGNVGGNQLYGGLGNDTLEGFGGNDLLVQGGGGGASYGGDGNDTLVGGSGAEKLVGSAGRDWVNYVSSLGGVSVNLQGGYGSGGWAQGDTYSGVESVEGSGYADVLTGDTLANALKGAGGNDILYGREGNDTLQGGDGDDALFGGTGADLVDGGAGLDTARFLTFGVAVNLTTGVHGGEAAGDVFVSVERFEGTAGADTFVGDAANQVFRGGSGDDLLRGMGGNDLLAGGLGADTLDGGSGADVADFGAAVSGVGVNLALGLAVTWGVETDALLSIEGVIGSKFNDDLRGGAAAESLIGEGGNDRLEGGGGADTVAGGLGDDTVVGGAGDVLVGNEGTDELRFGEAASVVNLATGVHGGAAAGAFITGFERVLGGAGVDVMQAGAAAMDFRGAGGADTLLGGAGADSLYGGTGNDRLAGGGGADLLVGGAGDDVLDAGPGADAIRYALGDGRDAVFNFSAADDTIQLGRASFGAGAGDPISEWVVLGPAAPDADHGYLLVSGGTIRWDADGLGGVAAETVMAFQAGGGGPGPIIVLPGAAPTSLADFAWV